MNKTKITKQIIKGSTDQMLYKDKKISYATDKYMKMNGMEPDELTHCIMSECMSIGEELSKGKYIATGVAIALVGVWFYNKYVMKKNIKELEISEDESSREI